MVVNYTKLENTNHNLALLKDILKGFSERFSPPLVEMKPDIDNFALQLINNAVVVVANQRNAIIGFIAIYINDYKTKTAFISLIAVKSDYQGRNIGKQLLSIAERYSHQNNMAFIRLEVKQKNKRAIEFYHRNGYLEIKETESSLLLEKVLLK